MKASRPNLVISAFAIGLFFGAFGVWSLLRQGSEPKPALKQVQEMPEGAAPIKRAGAPTATPAAVQQAVAPAVTLGTLSAATKNVILECTRGVESLRGVSQPDDFSTLDEYLKKAVTPTGGTRISRQIQFVNVHVKDARGEILRLHMTAPDRVDGRNQTMQLKLFAVDKEDLPVPQPLPSQLKGVRWDAALERFKRQGEVVFDEVSEAQRWDEQAGAQVIRRNGRIEQMALYLADGALACAREKGEAEPNCKCL